MTFWRCYWAFWALVFLAVALFEPAIEGGAEQSYGAGVALMWGFCAAFALIGAGVAVLGGALGGPGGGPGPTQSQLLQRQNELIAEQNRLLARQALRRR